MCIESPYDVWVTKLTSVRSLYKYIPENGDVGVTDTGFIQLYSFYFIFHGGRVAIAWAIALNSSNSDDNQQYVNLIHLSISFFKFCFT